jgi:hypothetical protein
LIWSTITQESNLERKGQILGENHVFPKNSYQTMSDPTGQYPM